MMDKIRRIGIRADLAKHQHKMEIKALEAENKRLREALDEANQGTNNLEWMTHFYRPLVIYRTDDQMWEVGDNSNNDLIACEPCAHQALAKARAALEGENS